MIHLTVKDAERIKCAIRVNPMHIVWYAEESSAKGTEVQLTTGSVHVVETPKIIDIQIKNH